MIGWDLGSRCELAVLNCQDLCSQHLPAPMPQWAGPEVMDDPPTQGRPLRALEPTHVLQLKPATARLEIEPLGLGTKWLFKA